MIARLVGTLVAREPNRGIVDVGGVGYEVFAPSRSLDVWQAAQRPIEVHVSTQVREDAITLFGFETAIERQAFGVLLDVNSVGPKLALGALDALALPVLVAAVEKDDFTTLCRIPGVGKKTAQRLALELKGRLPMSFSPSNVLTPGVPATGDDTLAIALGRLGYSRAEIDRVRQGMTREGVSPDAPITERLKLALRLLYEGDR